jgi:sarcosine oxidase
VPQSFDVIVIGLGAVGAATAYQLAKSGARVLGLDRYAPPHDLGSTHGETRITRLACGEGIEYTPFARRSHEIWRALEHETGESLLVQNGLLVISGAGKRAAAHGNREFLKTTVDAAEAHGVAHERLRDADIRQRFPAFGIADGDAGYFEPEAGFAFPERCLSVQLRLARQLGAALHMRETALDFTCDSDGVRVFTDEGEYSAGRLVLAAGPWLPKLLPNYASEVAVRRQVLFWFRLHEDANRTTYEPQRFPVFYWQVPRRQAIYGFPSIDGGRTIKLATEQYETETDPDAVDRNVSADEVRVMYTDYVAPIFPGVSDTCERSSVCLYTCTDQARFIVDELPEAPRVIVASPCSGHGFKHSAALGEASAQLASGLPPTLDLTPFRLQVSRGGVT